MSPVAAQNTTLDLDGIGPVIFARSRRARRLSIAIRPFRPVRVAYPWRSPLREARRWFDEKRGWVEKTVARIRDLERQHNQTVGQVALPSPAEGRARLIGRLEELARRHGFTYNRVFLRRQKSRWGSCSEANNINLNVNLLRLKPELVDYVLLHELVHTRIKNHSPAFWAELGRVLPNARALDRMLKQHHLGL